MCGISRQWNAVVAANIAALSPISSYWLTLNIYTTQLSLQPILCIQTYYYYYRDTCYCYNTTGTRTSITIQYNTIQYNGQFSAQPTTKTERLGITKSINDKNQLKWNSEQISFQFALKTNQSLRWFNRLWQTVPYRQQRSLGQIIIKSYYCLHILLVTDSGTELAWSLDE